MSVGTPSTPEPANRLRSTFESAARGRFTMPIVLALGVTGMVINEGAYQHAEATLTGGIALTDARVKSAETLQRVTEVGLYARSYVLTADPEEARRYRAAVDSLHQVKRSAFQLQPHPDVSHANFQPAQLGVAQAHLADGGHLVFGRRRQFTLAGQQLAARAGHLVVHGVGIVGTQNLAGGLRQIELRLALVHRHELRQRVGVVFERTVERLVGNALRHQPGQRQAHRPQQEQRGEHPVQDFAEQGALLSLEDLQGWGSGLE